MLSDEQLLKRRGFLCASDAPAIMRQSPFASPHAIWLEKHYTTEPITDNEAMNRGNRHELPLGQNAAERLGVTIISDPEKLEFEATGPTGVPWLVHPDHLVNEHPWQIECKVTSMWNHWGEEEFTNVIADMYQIQAQVQMSVARMAGHQIDTTYFAVMLPWYGRIAERIYKMDYNERLWKIIEGYCTTWWERYVVEGQPCDDRDTLPSDLAVVQRIVRETGKQTDIPKKLCDEYKKFRQCENNAKMKKEAAQARMLEAFGTAEIAQAGDDVIEYLEQPGRRSVNYDALRERWPEVYAQVVKTGKPSRRLNVKEGARAVTEVYG